MKEIIAGSIILSLLTLAAWIAVVIFISKEFEHIAVLKGHDGRRYFWWTFFLGPVGMLMVIALPTVSRPDRYEDDPDDLPGI